MAPTSGDFEAQANRLRSKMGQTVGELRSNLTPAKLASEARVTRRRIRTLVARCARFCEHATSRADGNSRIRRCFVAFGSGSQA